MKGGKTSPPGVADTPVAAVLKFRLVSLLLRLVFVVFNFVVVVAAAAAVVVEFEARVEEEEVDEGGADSTQLNSRATKARRTISVAG